MARLILTLIYFAWSACMDCLLTSKTFPSLHPISITTSSYICSKGSHHTWTQKGEWEKEIFVDVNPFLQRQRRRRLLSKFQEPLLSTQSSWNIELNLNCKILFPTSMILRSDPIFQASLKALLRALRFWWRSARRWPKRLWWHSSISSGLLAFVMEMLSSSSFVSYKFLSWLTTSFSMVNFWIENWSLVIGRDEMREKYL